MLLDREVAYRQDKRMGARLRHAKLRHQAAPEDIDYRAPRGLDRHLVQELLKGSWLEAHENLIISGPTGVGKSWLGCAIAHKACRDNRSVLYVRAPKLFDDQSKTKLSKEPPQRGGIIPEHMAAYRNE